MESSADELEIREIGVLLLCTYQRFRDLPHGFSYLMRDNALRGDAPC